MAEIDSIDIKISAETRKANAAIDSLVKNLGKLANSLKIDTSGIEKLGKIDGSNFQKLGEGIRGLSSGLKNLQNVKKTDFNRLASGIERLSSIQTGNMQAVSSTLKPLADGVSILSNANFDNKNLQSMINSLTRLSNSNIGSLPNVDFTGIGNSLKNLTDSLAGAEKVQQSTISMTNAIAKLADSVANIPIVSSLLSQLGSSLKGFMTTMSGAPAVTEQTTAFTQAIAQLSGAGTKVATTASNLGTLATELKAFMKTMSNAPVVSDSTIKMTQALANLASQGNKTGNATKGLQAVFSSTESIGNKFNSSVKKLSSSMKGLGDSVKKTASKMKSFKTELLSAFGVVGGLYGAIRGIQKSIDISSDLVEVQNVVDTTFKDMSYKVEELAKTSIEQFGLSELSLKQFSSRFQAMGTAMGFPISRMSDMSIELTKLTADMSSFYNVAQEDVARSLQSIFTGETEPLRKYGLDLTQATLQEWALKQGLDADMRSMSQAEKTMLRYQYVLANTTAAQGDFAKTANTWANQIRILRQQFEQLASIIGSAFVNMLKPVVQSLNKAMAKVIEFAQTVINALGKIFGWKFEINTKGIAGDFSGIEDGIGDLTGGIEDATEASKKFNKQLQGFDKLNNLTTSDAGKDLEDFGDGLGNIGDLGDIVPGEGLFDKYESDIDTLYKLGKYLGETLKNFLDNIPWDVIKKKAREIGEGLADLIAGFIQVDGLGYSIGKTLSESINVAFELLNAFVHKLPWKDLGHFIADTLNGFFENIDWELIRDTFVTGFKGLADAINKFIDDFHWDNISNTISNAINIIAETVYTFFSTVNWDELGRNLGEQLRKTIEKIDWEMVGRAIGSVLQSAFDFAKNFLKEQNFESIKNAISNLIKGFFEEVNVKDLTTALTLVLSAAFAKISFKKILSKMKIKSFGKELGKALGLATGDTVKSLDVLKKSFSNFKFGIENGNFLTGLNEGLKVFRDNLTGLQKGMITGVAGFSEFKVISETFEGLVSGSENVISGIAKIGSAAGIAAAAMYTALGPAGLAIAAITGVAAAVKGINDAFDSIRAEEIGASIKNAMSNPGGTPIPEVTKQFAEAINGIGDSFTVITEKSAGLEQADKHIRDTWMEIEKIETSMETGVISVDEGKQELERLFGELAQTASEKFGLLEDTLLSAFGENGVLSSVFDRLGVSTENTTSTIIQLNDKVEKRIEELTGLLAKTDPSNPNYTTYKEELAGLMSQTDELTEAISKYDFALQSIDYSDLILPDGTLDTTALQNFLGELKTATENANTDIENAINSTRQSLEEEKSLAESLGDWVAAEEIQTKLDALPRAMDLLKGDISLKATELTDAMQIDFIGGLNGVIEDAKNEWGEKGFWGQTWNGIFGAGTEGEFVKEAVDKQVENIGQLSSAIETELGGLKVDGIAWGSDAINGIYESLFDTEYHYSDMGGGKTVYSLNENFKSLINQSTEGLSELASERGKEAVDGYANGFTDESNVAIAQGAAKSFTEKVMDAIAEAQDSHSPSKVTEKLGKDAVDGYNLGITNNTSTTLNSITQYMNNIKNKFSEIISPLTQIGANAMKGFYNGLSSMESAILEKSRSIAKNVAKSMQSALDIHSPSRVMFELGDFAMQGFQNGLESLYQPIISSVKSFGSDLTVAPAMGIDRSYMDYGRVNQYIPEYQPYQSQGYQRSAQTVQSDSELKALLRENNSLLRAILEKPNISDGEIYNSFQSSYQSEAKRKGVTALDPVIA